MVMPDPSYTAIQLMVVGTLSKKYGWEFYQKLRANEVMIVQGHQQVSETLTRGERLIAAEGADQYAWLDRKAGHKVQTIFPTDGAFLIPAPTAVIKGSPHPNAAKAFAEFMIGDTVQKLFPGEGIYAAPLRRGAAARQPSARPDQAHERGLRCDREGVQGPQDEVQRDLPVAGGSPTSRLQADDAAARAVGEDVDHPVGALADVADALAGLDQVVAFVGDAVVR